MANVEFRFMTKTVDDFVEVIVNEHKLNHIEGQRDDYPSAFLSERQVRLKKNPNDTIFSGKQVNLRIFFLISTIN